YSEDSSALLSRLRQLQCHFTWDLKLDVDLETLSSRLQIDIDFHRSPYLQDQREEALSLLNQSEETIRESYGDESERRLIVTYGDMAWLKYHDGDFERSKNYCQRYPTGSSGRFLPEVYGEQGWAYFKVSRSSISKAIDCFRKALEVQTQDVEWNTGYAVALFCTEKVFENLQEDEESEAIKQLRFALEINPNNAALQCMLAVKLAAYKKYEEADDLVEKARENDPDNPHVIRSSGNYLRNRSPDIMKRALEIVGTQLSSFNYQLAMCYKDKKIAEQCRPFKEVRKLRRCCISHLEESVTIKPSFFLALADLALLYAEEGDMKLKEKLCQIIHQYYGDFYLYHKKNEAQAIAHYTKVSFYSLKKIAKRRLDNNPGDGEALALLDRVAEAEAAEFNEDCELHLELQGSSSD
uniref:Uncharacterized protein n=1 Tax=Neolamprologus brichardi TaxID=32507 RepID=A0A3Q4GN49_NEOBR